MARIRKQQPTQTGDHATQKSFRLYHDQDGALIDWLAEYAKRYKQTDLIRLALYTLSGLDMPAELADLLPPQQAPRQLPLPEPDRASDQIEQLFTELDTQRREANEQIATLYQELSDEKHRASQQLETMIAQLAELRHDMHQRQPVSAAATVAYQDHVATAPDRPPTMPESPGNVVSSGIDMSRPRPRPAPRQAPAAAPPVDNEPLCDQDAIRLAKIMANSIKRAQPGRG
jgi:hypothetical protein